MSSVDVDVARWVADHRTAPLTSACRFLEDLGTSYVFLATVALAGLGLVAYRGPWSGLRGVLIALVVLLPVNGTLKRVIDRPRPPADLAITVLGGQAMPSSHAVMTSAVAVAVVLGPWWTSRRWQLVVAVLGVVGCLITGGATIYLGGHWLSDVLVGWALGVGVTVAAMLVAPRLARRGVRTSG